MLGLTSDLLPSPATCQRGGCASHTLLRAHGSMGRVARPPQRYRSKPFQFSLPLLCPSANPFPLCTSVDVSVKWWWWVRRLGPPIRGSHPLGQCQALAVEGGLLISHKTNQEQLGGLCTQAASYKQGTQEEGIPLLNHRLMDSSAPKEHGW